MYTCDICNNVFSRRWNYQRHITRKHPFRISKADPGQNQGPAITTNKPDIVKKLDLTNPLVRKLCIDLFRSMELLEKYLADRQKNKVLSAALINSLSTSNPVKDLDERAHIVYANHCKIQLISYISRGNSMAYPQAEAFFNNLLTTD